MINYPVSLDTLPTDILGTDKQSARDHALLHNDANDAINELEVKVGAINSTVTTSHDYRIRTLESDIVGPLANEHTHPNKPLIDSLINTGSATDLLGADGNYHATHSHLNLPVLNGIINTGVGSNYLGDDGGYHPTHNHSNMSALNNVIDTGAANEFLAADGTYYTIGGTGASGHDIQYDTVGLPVRSILNFYGAGIKVYDNAGTDSVDIYVEGINSATGSAYVHENPALNTNWYVNHELNTTDIVLACYDMNGHLIEFDSIDFVDSDNLTIHFSGNACGKAVLLTKGTSGSGGCCDDGLSGYTHSQITASDDRTVIHNLETEDVITMVYDNIGHFIEFDDLEVIDNNTVRIRFTNPVSGKAVVLCEMRENCTSCSSGQACEIQHNDVNVLTGVETLNFTGAGVNTVTAVGNKVTVDIVGGGGGGGEINTTSNAGTGEGLALAKVGVDLPFKSIVAGTNVTLVPSPNELRIDVAGTINGFHEHTQGSAATTWNVNHSLGTQTITFRAYDTSGNWIEPDSVNIVDDNNMTVLFSSAVAGSLSVISGGGTTSSGEVNTASNLGAGEGTFASKVGSDLQFKSLIAGTNITLTSTGNDITINSTSTASGFYDHTQGSAATTWNVNHSLGSDVINFRAYDTSGNWIEPDSVNIVDNNNLTVTFSSAVAGSLAVLSGGGTVASGEVNTASNLGTGHGPFSSKVGSDLQFKSIVAGTNVTITDDANEITINATASGGTALPVILSGTTHTAVANDAVMAGNTTAETTITLPSAAANAGEKIMVKKNNASAFDTNIVLGTAGDTINGDTAGATIVNEHTSIVLISDGVDTRHVF